MGDRRLGDCTFPAPCSEREVESIGVWVDGDLTIDTASASFVIDYRDIQPALDYRERLLEQEARDHEEREREAIDYRGDNHAE